MDKYLFDTTVTMKKHDNKKWWIDGAIIPLIHLSANNLNEALEKYAEIAKEKYYISISPNAMRKKNNMYVDTKEGESIQTGYVITGKTSFDNNSGKWIDKYIDLWVNISIVTLPNFESPTLKGV